MQTTDVAEGVNPLIPNGTFFVELIIFLLVLLVMWRVILPPIQKALKDRHDMAQKTIDDNREATKQLTAAREKKQETLAEARAESGSIRDEARGRGQAVLDEFRSRAEAEAATVREDGERRMAEPREQVLEDLHGRIGPISETLASRVVGADVTTGNGHRELVDGYLGRLSTPGGA